MHKRGQGFQPDRVFFQKPPDPGPPELGNIAQSPQRLGDIPDPGTDVSPFATKDFEHGLVGVGLDQPGLIDLHRTGFQGDLFALPGQVIGPFAPTLMAE